MDQTEAREFFSELAVFSERFAAVNGWETIWSPWGSDKWTKPFATSGPGRGAVIHYTADPDFGRVCRWFAFSRFQSRVSAHFVVSDGFESGHQRVAKGLSLIEKYLPVTVVMCRRLEQTAWHATWTNNWTYGIENVNPGELRRGPEGFVTWRRKRRNAAEWTDLWMPVSASDAPVEINGRFWAPYAPAQVVANIVLLKALRGFCPCFARIPGHILGHSLVQANKSDPGPDFPLHDVRRAVVPMEAAASLSSAEQMLYQLGYAVDPESLDFSIRLFQKMSRLVVDGLAGSRTRAALERRLSLLGYR